MTYVVAGVSGNTGSIAADTLLAQGKSVRVIVRDAAKGAPWKAKGAEVAVADLSDATALASALRGAEGAYLLVPPNMAAPLRAHQDAVVASLVEAVKASGVPHVVLLSSTGAQHAAGTGPIVGLHRAEQALRALPGVALTFLRAAYFMENLGGSLGMLGDGVLPSFTPKDFAFDMVATQDIGKTAAGLLVEGGKGTQIVELGGPPRSMSDAAAALSTILGKTITVTEAPLEAMVPTLTGFGLPKDLAEAYEEMTRGIVARHVAFEGGHRRVQGTTQLSEVLKTLVGANRSH